MKLTYKEAAKIIEEAISLWDALSSNPEDLSAMSDHCHDVHDEALYVASKLKEHEGDL